jgi:hypothetical protein
MNVTVTQVTSLLLMRLELNGTKRMKIHTLRGCHSSQRRQRKLNGPPIQNSLRRQCSEGATQIQSHVRWGADKSLALRISYLLICSTTKRSFLRWVKVVRTTKS